MKLRYCSVYFMLRYLNYETKVLFSVLDIAHYDGSGRFAKEVSSL